MKRDVRSVAEKLAARLVVDPATGCHNWTGAKNLKGYGRFQADSGCGLLLPHRVAYELARGAIPPSMVIDHLCRNPACCNADHLEAVTQGENVRRGNSGLRQKLRTHCPLGHPYDADNTYSYGGKAGRRCRTCSAAQGKSRRRVARAEVAASTGVKSDSTEGH